MKNLKLVLKSLFSNNACIEGGRHRPWWIAIIIFLLSMWVAVVPVFTQTITKTGSAFANNYTYGVDAALQEFIEEAEDKGLKMVVKEAEGLGHYLDLNKEDWDAAFAYEDSYGYRGYQHINSESLSDMDVFYVPDLKTDDLNKIIKDVKQVDAEGKETYENRKNSFMVFGKTEFVLYQFNMNSTTAVGNTYGDYKNIEVGTDLIHIGSVTINEETVTRSTVTPEKYAQYKEGVWNNWKDFFDKGYLWNRGELTWRTTLLMVGINAGITLFMGLMIFILTRGKTNPFRIYTFMECELIAGWATLSPSILALAFGFLFSNFAQVIFPLLLGVRVMWMSMKSLRPEYTAAPQQNQKVVKTVNVKSK